MAVFEKKHTTQETYGQALVEVYEALHKLSVIKDKKDIQVVGIRTVVPAADFVNDIECTPEVYEKLKLLQDMDPLHITPVLQEVEEVRDFFDPALRIYFISDSKFHISSQRQVPVPFEKPRYTIGYHGLSCESILRVLKEHDIEHNKLIVAHLGGGSSVSAIRNSTSTYNSMEGSPVNGVLMSSRSGSIDPFLALLYMKEKNLSYQETLSDLYSKSGLKSISGVSSDMRVIREEAFKGNQQAKQAILQFVDSVVAHICKASAYTQGIDTLVFTGMVGVRASYIREMIVEKLLWLGCVVDHNKNIEVSDSCCEISAHNSKIKIFVVQIDEMKEMHTHLRKLV
jgi:acetate kinase